MSVMIIFSLFLSSVSFADVIGGMGLIHAGKLREGYKHLEKTFQMETDKSEKGRIAQLLSYGIGTETNPVYYSRYALKYHPSLSIEERQKLEIRIADSFMEYGEFTKAHAIYIKLRNENSELKDYINHQLGYYYLNRNDRAQAFAHWSEASDPEIKRRGLRSLGRYWEKLGFPGEIESLSRDLSFMEGFSVFVDERDKILTVNDLNIFVEKKSSASMLALLIERNPLFIKNACGFVQWYKHSLDLPNNLIFPYLEKCLDKDTKRLKKVVHIVEHEANTKEEKRYLVSLYEKSDKRDSACRLASKESFHSIVLTDCPERSEDILKSIPFMIHKDQSKLLRASRVIRSSFKLPVEDQKKIIELVGEGYFSSHFLDNPAEFKLLTEQHMLSDESLLKFAAFHRSNKETFVSVKRLLKSQDAKNLLSYLESGKDFQGNICSIQDGLMKKIAIESKLLHETYTNDEINCSKDLIEMDESLVALATKKIIKHAERIEIIDNASIVESLLSNDSTRKIKAVTGDLGKDIAVILQVQSYHSKPFLTSEELLSELKRLRLLRAKVALQKWSDEKTSKKAISHFNRILDSFLGKNRLFISKMNLLSQVEIYIQEMRIG